MAAKTPAPAAPAIERRRLAFTRPNGVYVGRSDGTRSRRLTRLSAFEYQPDWSPDGSRLLVRVDGHWIAFKCPRGACAARADGTQRRVILNGLDAGFPAWDPTG